MGKKIGDFEKSEIVNRYLQGERRDDIAEDLHVSAGAVSKATSDFHARVEATSLEDAAQEYDAVDIVDKFRQFWALLRKSGMKIGQVIYFLKILEPLGPPDKYPQIIHGIERLQDRGFAEAAGRLVELEKQTGEKAEQWVEELEEGKRRRQELEAERQTMQSQITSLKTEMKSLEEAVVTQKTRLNTELQETLRQNSLSMEQVRSTASTFKALKDFGVDVTQLEDLKKMLVSSQAAGFNPANLAELAKKAEALNKQVTAENEKLSKTRLETTRLEGREGRLEKKFKKAKPLLEKAKALESAGWNADSLEKALQLTKAVGKPEEVLCRLELFESLDKTTAEVEQKKAEARSLARKNMRMTKKAAKTLRETADKAAVLLDRDLPAFVAKTEEMLNGKILTLTSEYNELAERYGKLRVECDSLFTYRATCQKALDEAFGWEKFFNQPDKAPAELVNHLFLDIMLPQLQLWARNRTPEQKLALMAELAKRAVILHDDMIQAFMEDPAKADYPSAALTCGTTLTALAPFWLALDQWITTHEDAESTSGLSDVKQYLGKAMASFHFSSSQKTT